MKRIPALLAIGALATLACNLLQSAADDLAATAETAVESIELPEQPLPTATQAPAEPATQPADEPFLDDGNGPDWLDLDDAETYGEPIDHVNSYRFAMRFAFEGGSNGAPVRGSVTGTGQRTRDPEAMRLRFEAFEAALQPGELPFEFSLVDSVVSVADPSMGCVVLPTGSLVASPMSYLIDVSQFLNGQAVRLRPDQRVNGVPSYRFSLDGSNVAAGELEVEERIQGTIYIARQGGYLVRLELSGTGTSEMLSGAPELPGQISYSLDYFDLNQSIQVTPLEGCDQTPTEVNYPVTEDAYELFSIFGTISYKTDLPLEEVVQFYKDEMAAAGWTLSEEFSVGPFAALNFSGESGTVQVTLALDEDTQTVEVGIIEID